MIRAKVGVCCECEKELPLIAKRCKTCYWQHRAKINAKKPKAIEKKLGKAKLSVFFASQIIARPKHCENCGADLRASMGVNPRAIVCHILPKAPDHGFPSVASHSQNKFYGCNDCHDKYDNMGRDFILTMPLLPTLKERVQLLLPHLTPDELRRVPNYLL